MARCSCDTKTCFGCKDHFEDDNHQCVRSAGITTKPAWLPEYAADGRIKPCPTCNMWIEHKEACNHMTCCYCSHQFCFVCLLPWEGDFPDLEGCPAYGDPTSSYDNEGYELARGIHRDSGYD